MRRNYGKCTFGVGTLLTLALIGNSESIAESVYSQTNLSTQSGRNVYIGLSYSPSWHNIQNFSVGASDGSTVAWYPGLRNSMLLRGSSFNWQVPNPAIRFQNNPVRAFDGSIGYRKRRARVELEISYQQFEPRATALGAKNEITETTHLLAKNLAHYVMSGNGKGLSKALAATDPRDIVAFAQEVGRVSPEIDGKVCNKTVLKPKIRSRRKEKDPGAWSCVDHVSKYRSAFRELNTLSKRFGKLELHDKKRPVTLPFYTNRGWPGTEDGKIDTAEGMASDLVRNLTQEEKAVVAGILSETISGAEVVEISDITATTVLVNACYDVGRAKLAPFACLGIGPSFISVANGHYTPKLSFKLKAGLSYEMTPRIALFANVFYHKIFGDGYYDIPVRHLATNAIPVGRSADYATAKFNMAVTGADLGVRFVF